MLKKIILGIILICFICGVSFGLSFPSDLRSYQVELDDGWSEGEGQYIDEMENIYRYVTTKEDMTIFFYNYYDVVINPDKIAVDYIANAVDYSNVDIIEKSYYDGYLNEDISVKFFTFIDRTNRDDKRFVIVKGFWGPDYATMLMTLSVPLADDNNIEELIKYFKIP